MQKQTMPFSCLQSHPAPMQDVRTARRRPKPWRCHTLMRIMKWSKQQSRIKSRIQWHCGATATRSPTNQFVASKNPIWNGSRQSRFSLVFRAEPVKWHFILSRALKINLLLFQVETLQKWQQVSIAFALVKRKLILTLRFFWLLKLSCGPNGQGFCSWFNYAKQNR